jgi:hypothetical protein
MAIHLSDFLIPKLLSSFSGDMMRLAREDNSVAVFSSKHPDIGDLVIQDDGDEFTIFLGRFTHVHFNNYDEGLSDREKAERIANDVVVFLQKLFADQIEFYGTGSVGGWRERHRKKRGIISKFILAEKTYVWSGPVKGNDA